MAADTGLRIHNVAQGKKHMPGRKMSLTRYTTRPPPQFEMVKPPSPSENVVVSIQEARPSTSESSTKTSADGSSGDEESKKRPRRPTITIPAKTYAPEVSRVEELPAVPPPPPVQMPMQNRAASPANVPLPRSANDSPVPPRSDSRATTAVPSEQTPVHRSVFPVYNPTIPLANQSYQPNPSLVPALTRMRDVAGPSQKRNSIDKSQLAPPIQSSEKKESPLKRSDSIKRPSGYSRPEELADLWSLANGQHADSTADTYALELSCDDLTLNSEVITFSSTQSPVYVLSASQQSQFGLCRINPTDTRTKIPICSSTWNRPTRHDPLVASLFPKLAGLLALDESSTTACERRLDRQASAFLQADAIRQAQDREASMLLWDYDSGRFCVLHPTLLDGGATSIRIEITPSPTAPERIIFYAPETDSLPLLTLDMPTLCLTIHANSIRALPSLYILDSLVTAMLTLLLHLHRLCADPSFRHTTPPQPEENAIYFPPPPPSLHSTASRKDLRRQQQQAGLPQPGRPSSRASAFRSVRSVRSTRSLASRLSGAPTAAGDKDIELGIMDPETGRAVVHANAEDAEVVQFGGPKRKAPKGIIDANDPALPTGTRAALRFVYWVFEVVYWVLGTLVHLAALAVVGLGKFVTKL